MLYIDIPETGAHVRQSNSIVMPLWSITVPYWSLQYPQWVYKRLWISVDQYSLYTMAILDVAAFFESFYGHSK